MSRKLRARKTEEGGIGKVFERVVEGMRNEMSTVLWRIERSRDGSPEALKKLIKTGLEAMVGAVEKAMYGVSDGLTKEWKEKVQDEEASKDRIDVEEREGGERKSKEDDRWRKIEDRLERKLRESEEKWKDSVERLKKMEEKLEREGRRQMEEGGGGEGGMRITGRSEMRKSMEDRVLDGTRRKRKTTWEYMQGLIN
jgi:hypothetical protein